MNEEALFETSDTESVQAWFDELWEHCDLLDDGAIDDYANSRRSNPPAPQSRPPAALNLTPLQMLQGVRDWGSYVAALEQCDEWWGDHPGSWSVLGDHCSWRETVAVLHDVVSQQDWGRLGEGDRRRLLGLTYGEDESWALLGRMRQSSLNTVFRANQEKI